MQSWYNIHKSIDVRQQINKIKDKNHVILTIDAERAFDRIQHPFLIKTLSKVGLEGPYLNIMKAIYYQPMASIILDGQKLQVFPLRAMSNETVLSSFTSLFNIVLDILATAIRHKEKIKGIQTGKEEVKLSSFADAMILYTENPKDSTKKLVELKNKPSKVAGYKINIQKSVAFLYANNEQKRKLRKQTHSQLLKIE